MTNLEKRFCLEVRGDFACFTRPEMKVERVSYDVITPSAARAVFEAIFWKPAIRWHIREIEVLSPVRWISVRRNEVGATASTGKDSVFIEEHRLQRAGLFLRDVRYRLHAWLEYIPVGQRKTTIGQVPEMLWDNDERQEMEDTRAAWQTKQDETPGKYLAMFERRARKGQCFNQPYLGCREFSAYFRLVENPERESALPIAESRDLGFMLYDMDFANPDDPRPAFYRAELRQGRIIVPPWDSKEVHK